MKKESFDAICRALKEADVPFLIVGGIAVIHHGYGRMTQDVDLVIRLESEIIQKTFEALASINYHPAVPITAEDFANPQKRREWQQNKGMKVLKFWSDTHRETQLDVFIEEPFDFFDTYKNADIRESLPGLEVRIIPLNTLLEMKKQSGRPQDLADIDELNLFHGNPSSYDEEK